MQYLTLDETFFVVLSQSNPCLQSIILSGVIVPSCFLTYIAAFPRLQRLELSEIGLLDSFEEHMFDQLNHHLLPKLRTLLLKELPLKQQQLPPIPDIFSSSLLINIFQFPFIRDIQLSSLIALIDFSSLMIIAPHFAKLNTCHLSFFLTNDSNKNNTASDTEQEARTMFARQLAHLIIQYRKLDSNFILEGLINVDEAEELRRSLNLPKEVCFFRK